MFYIRNSNRLVIIWNLYISYNSTKNNMLFSMFRKFTFTLCPLHYVHFKFATNLLVMGPTF